MAAPEQLFGSGIRWPLEITANGDLALVEGTEAIWQALTILLGNPEPPPLDPHFTLDVSPYDPMRDAYSIGQSIARSIKRNETRLEAVHVATHAYDANEMRLLVRVEITPLESVTSEVRTFPFWQHRG